MLIILITAHLLFVMKKIIKSVQKPYQIICTVISYLSVANVQKNNLCEFETGL